MTTPFLSLSRGRPAPASAHARTGRPATPWVPPYLGCLATSIRRRRRLCPHPSQTGNAHLHAFVLFSPSFFLYRALPLSSRPPEPSAHAATTFFFCKTPTIGGKKGPTKRQSNSDAAGRDQGDVDLRRRLQRVVCSARLQTCLQRLLSTVGQLGTCSRNHRSFVYVFLFFYRKKTSCLDFFFGPVRHQRRALSLPLLLIWSFCVGDPRRRPSRKHCASSARPKTPSAAAKGALSTRPDDRAPSGKRSLRATWPREATDAATSSRSRAMRARASASMTAPPSTGSCGVVVVVVVHAQPRYGPHRTQDAIIRP